MESSGVRTVIAAVALRAALVLSGLGPLLSWRVEVSTPTNSLLKIREGVALLHLGVSPYTGSSCHVPPLLLRLLGSVVQHELLYALPNIAFDLVAAGLLLWAEQSLRAAASRCAGSANPWRAPALHLASLHLFNPFVVAACVSGSLSSLEALCVILALSAGVARNAPLAAFGIAAGTLVGLHPLLLVVPIMLLCWRGPEQVFSDELASDARAQLAELTGTAQQTEGVEARPRPTAALPLGVGAAVAASDKHRDTPAAPDATAVAAPGPTTAAVTTSKPPQERQPSAPSPSPPATASCPASPSPSSTMRRPTRAISIFLLWVLVWLLALVALNDLSIRAFPQEQCLPAAAAAMRRGYDRLLLDTRSSTSSSSSDKDGSSSACLAATCAAADATAASAAARAWGALGTAGRPAITGVPLSCWLTHVYRLPLLAEDLQPNIGQFWYFFTELFDAFKAFFLFVFHSHALVLALPLALRFPSRPLALVAVQLVITAMFKPYPCVADLGAYLTLLPLLRPQLARMKLGLFTVNTGLLLLVLGPAMWHQWVDVESANSNFFWSITLLLGAWHTLLLLQLLLLTRQVEREAAGKGDGESAGGGEAGRSRGDAVVGEEETLLF